MSYSEAERRLAYSLVRKGLATEDEVRSAAARHPDLSLRDSLLESGIISKEELQHLSGEHDSGGGGRAPSDSGPAGEGSVTRTHILSNPGSAGSGHASGRAPGPTSIGENSLVAGRYRILQEVARGGMGIVYRAHDRRLDRICALKVCILGAMASAQDVQRFLTEARAMAKLSHANLLPIYDIGTHEGLPFYTMEFIEGEDLSDRVRAGGPLGVGEALRICGDVAEALTVVHEAGIIHRDLKPANIMLREDGRVVVMDFGLVKVEGSELTQSGAVLGTPKYMAPEQIDPQPDRTLDHRADIYALGAILYFLVTGQAPHEGESMMQILSRKVTRDPEPMAELRGRPVPPSVEALALACLSLRAEDRPPDCEAFIEAVLAIEKGRPNRFTSGPSTVPETLLTGKHAFIGGLFLILGSLFLLVQFGAFGERNERRDGTDVVATGEKRETRSEVSSEETESDDSDGDEEEEDTADSWSLSGFDTETPNETAEKPTGGQPETPPETEEGGGGGEASEDEISPSENPEGTAGPGKGENQQVGQPEAEENEPRVEEEPAIRGWVNQQLEAGAPASKVLAALDGEEPGWKDRLGSEALERLRSYSLDAANRFSEAGEVSRRLRLLAWVRHVLGPKASHEEAFEEGFQSFRERLDAVIDQKRPTLDDKGMESLLNQVLASEAEKGSLSAFGYHFQADDEERSPREAAPAFAQHVRTYVALATWTEQALPYLLAAAEKNKMPQLAAVDGRVGSGPISARIRGEEWRILIEGEAHTVHPNSHTGQDGWLLLSLCGPFWVENRIQLSGAVAFLAHRNVDPESWARAQVRGGSPDPAVLESVKTSLGPFARSYLSALATARKKERERVDLREEIKEMRQLDVEIADRLAEHAREIEKSWPRRMPPQAREGFVEMYEREEARLREALKEGKSGLWGPYLRFFRHCYGFPALGKRVRTRFSRRAARKLDDLFEDRIKAMEKFYRTLGRIYDTRVPRPDLDANPGKRPGRELIGLMTNAALDLNALHRPIGPYLYGTGLLKKLMRKK